MKVKNLWLVALFLLPASTASADIDLQFTDIAEGMTGILHVTHANDGSDRIFLVQRRGVIWIHENGTILPTPFLDVSDLVSERGEQGMFSMAFPPELGPKDRFYVNYTDNSGDVVVARFRISQNVNVAIRDSQELILSINQPFANHNGGQIAFGADGMLYVSSGDGGGAGDPLEAGQDLTTLLGKILRIDVTSGVESYSIPHDNPFAGTNDGTRKEIWAFGLRNPWRVAFDRVSGEFYIADVGQNTWEEINRQPVGSPGGENYGWNQTEGPACFTPNCDVASFIQPVEWYSHDVGCSITGGHVYRGSLYPALKGMYVYGDFCTGRIWGLGNDRGARESVELADTDFLIATFGEDQAGNVYVSNLNGGVYLLSDGAPASERVAIGPQHSGSWHGGPSRDGEGFSLEVLSSVQLVAYWFTYDTNGRQIWVVGVGNIVGDTVTVDGFITEGGVFGPAYDPNDVDRSFWGTLTFTFDGCDSGTISYDSQTLGAGEFPIFRLTELAGLGC